MFESPSDREEFDTKLLEIQQTLTLKGQDIAAIQDHCREILDTEYEEQLAEAIDVTTLLGGGEANA